MAKTLCSISGAKPFLVSHSGSPDIPFSALNNFERLARCRDTPNSLATFLTLQSSGHRVRIFIFSLLVALWHLSFIKSRSLSHRLHSLELSEELSLKVVCDTSRTLATLLFTAAWNVINFLFPYVFLSLFPTIFIGEHPNVSILVSKDWRTVCS